MTEDATDIRELVKENRRLREGLRQQEGLYRIAQRHLGEQAEELRLCRERCSRLTLLLGEALVEKMA